MAVKWKKSPFPGVRFYEHETRKNGVKKDCYFSIRYQHEGKRKEEGLGWASQGWSAQRAAAELMKIKEAFRTGEGHQSLSEKRNIEKARREAEEKRRIKEARENIPLSTFFYDTYWPLAKRDKVPMSWKREESLMRLWVLPVIGKKPLHNISAIDLERIKKQMSDEGRTPRSVQYALATIRQVFNVARRLGFYNGDNPVRQVKIPKVNNRRLRFLTQEEARGLLTELSKISPHTHDIALLSLHCGLRAGEIFDLEWSDIDFNGGLIRLRDTKNGRTRYSYMTNEVHAMLKNRPSGNRDEPIFKTARGTKHSEISDAFYAAVKVCELNEAVTDKRDKVVFHTLRHTFASWLVMQGIDLYTVKELLGHRSLAMTERYAHLAPDAMRGAVVAIEKASSEKESFKISNM